MISSWVIKGTNEPIFADLLEIPFLEKGSHDVQ